MCLGALRLFRRVVQLKDEFYNRHIVKNRLFEEVVRCFKANGHRYNLKNSALLELFEFIKTVATDGKKEIMGGEGERKRSGC